MANMTLQEARQALGLSLEKLSEDVGISVSQLSRFETGSRDPRASELQRLARRLKIRAGAFLEGDTAPDVEVVGTVGAGAEASFFAGADAPDEWVPAPSGATAKTVAVRIKGYSLGASFDGWLAYYDDVRDPPGPDLAGKMCVVGLDDDRVLIKSLKPGRDGTWTLLSNTEPPIYDVIVIWAAKVIALLPDDSTPRKPPPLKQKVGPRVAKRKIQR